MTGITDDATPPYPPIASHRIAQTQAVLEVVSQLERRVAETEARAAEEGRVLRMEIARVLALLAPSQQRRVLEEEVEVGEEEEEDGPLAAALELIETLEAADAGGAEKGGAEEWGEGE